MDESSSICNYCGKALDDHALTIDKNGVVVAVSWSDELNNYKNCYLYYMKKRSKRFED